MTTESETTGPLVPLDNDPIWVVQARDGTKVFFDPDPIATEGWDQLLTVKAELNDPAKREKMKGKQLLDRLHTILGSFAVDEESKKAWERSLGDIGLRKTLDMMTAYAERVQGDLPM